jgi:hypothetical protein
MAALLTLSALPGQAAEFHPASGLQAGNDRAESRLHRVAALPLHGRMRRAISA